MSGVILNVLMSCMTPSVLTETKRHYTTQKRIQTCIVTNCSAVTVRAVLASTETSYSYQQYWLTAIQTDHVVFRVQACADAHLLLTEGVENEGKCDMKGWK